MTSSGALKLCDKCARDKNQCACCLGALDAVRPPEEKSTYIVQVNGAHYNDMEGEAAINAFQEDLVKWVSTTGHAVEVGMVLKIITGMTVACSESAAAALQEHPGVKNLEAD
jgi:hypothetical protein